MRKFHVLVHSLLLVTSPSLLAYPQYEQPTLQQIYNQEKPFDEFNLTYDGILKLLQDIENERLEDLSEEKINRITHFITFLAQKGMLPEDYAANVELENDIAALFGNKSDFFDYARDYDYAYASNFSYEPMVVSTLLNSEDAEISFCKSKHQKKEEERQKKQLKKEKERQKKAAKQAKKDAKKQKNHGNNNDQHHKHKNVLAKVKDFIVKHKQAIIIGAAIVVGITVIIVAVAAASSAAVAAAGAAAGAAAEPNPTRKLDTNENQENTSSTSPPADPPPEMMATHDLSALKSTIDHQIVSFKENITQNQFFQPTNLSTGQQGLSLEENGRALGSLFAHESYNSIQHQLSYPTLSQEIQDINSYTYPNPGWNQGTAIGHSEIDQKFSTDYSYLYSNTNQQVDFNTLSYQVRGEKALSSGYYNQAVQDLGKAIETNPTNPIPYLERGMAHFSLGQYDDSLEDYKQFASQTQVQTPNSLSVSEFSLGFAKGLPKGVYESGEGLLLFMADFVTHPINTSAQIVDSVTTLVNLVRNDEWGVVAESLSPEVHKLVTQWDTLSSEKKGELAGYAVGKHGTDILAPGALAKVASKSVKSAQELVAVCKNLQIAQETLILETAAGVGNSAKVAEVVRNGQTVAFLGEELGFTAQEMGQLKQAGKLESTINNGLEKLVSQSESEVFKAAISQNQHVKMVRDYLDKPAKEIQKGINSYEKQISIHKDKITNPTKYCPDWDKLDPRQREALINKKWPTEIKGYEEQRSVLQSILNERLSYE